MLLERGRYSGQLYFSQMNQRRLDLAKVRFPHGNDNDAMLKSFAMRPSGEDFNIGDSMALYLHGIESDDGCGDDKLQSMCEYHWPSSLVKNEDRPLFGYISGSNCVQLSNDAFTRLCNFFGYSWLDENTHEPCTHKPTVYDQALLIEALHTTDMKTPSGFKNFLKHHGMELLYKYNDDIFSGIYKILDGFCGVWFLFELVFLMGNIGCILWQCTVKVTGI